MKKCAFLLFAAIAFSLAACGGSKDNEVRNEARQSLDVQEQNPSTVPPPATTNPTITPPAGNTVAAAGGVQHYICPNNCEGSGGPSAGTCPVCGTEYTHNQAYHAQNNAATTTTPTGTTGTPTPPAATNAAGVYHYTCPNGCAGGAGAAGACATCGATLAHNAAYHQ